MTDTQEKKGYSEFEWTIKPAKNGSPTLLFGDRAVHSQYNPEHEAQTLAANIIRQAQEERADHIILLGTGLGYLPKAIYDAGWETLVAWDPFPRMQREFPRIDGAWRKCILINQFFRNAKNNIDQYVKPGAKPKVICHQNYDIYTAYEYRVLLDYLTRIYSPGEKPPVISERSLETLVRLPGLGTVKPYKDCFPNAPVLVVAPGPSLHEYISLLKNRNGIKIFAPVQAVPMLQEAGIYVDFIVSADPENMQMFFKNINSDFGMLLAELASHPETLDWQPKKTALFALESDQLYEGLWKSKQLPSFELHSATVSELMVALAQYMGFNEIICLGMDMCWQRKRYHGYRPSNEYDQRNATMDTGFNLKDMAGNIVSTQVSYFQALRFFNDYVSRTENSGVIYYQNNAGLDKGMKSIGINELRTMIDNHVPPSQPLAQRDSDRFDSRRIKSLLNKTAKSYTATRGKLKTKKAQPVIIPKESLRALPDNIVLGEISNALKRLTESQRKKF